MAIQMRRGSNAYYDESKMKPGEVAVATDTRQAYVGMGNGDAEELAFKRDLEGLGGGGGGGTTDHAQLTNRDAADQHPIESIRGLRAELDEQRIIATATGESIVLTDSSDKPLEGLVLYGKTTQNGTPSPTNPVPLVSAGNGGSIKVEVCGKNLLKNTANTQTLNGVAITIRDDGSVKISGTASATTFLNIGNVKLTANQIYVLSGGINSNVSIKWNYKGWADSGTGSQYRPTEDVTESIVLRIGSGTTVNETIYPMVRLLALTDATYEPYEGDSVVLSTPSGLPGIPVTGGGNYTDGNGQMYLSDCKNYKTGKHEHNVGRIDSYSGENVGDTWISSTGELSVGAAVLYALSEPYQEDIDPEELSAFAALTALSPVTTILNDGGAGMTVSYIADTKAYIDNKFAALQAAILSTGGNV